MLHSRPSHARAATLPCSDALGHSARTRHIPEQRCESKRGAIMAHLVDRHLWQRANTIVMLGMLWSGLAACVLGALVYDIALWLGR